jgi:hypothetical protein
MNSPRLSTTKTACAALALLLFAAADLNCQPVKKHKTSRPDPKAKEELVKPEPKTKEEIFKQVEASSAAYQGENLLARALHRVTLDTRNGPVIFLPTADSSRDLGPSFGIMPVFAIRRQGTADMKAVIVPSLSYNKNLGNTLTYRHYIFPDEQRYFILRASRSQRVERELMAYYYTPHFRDSDVRLSWEPKHWVTGKPSFYGMGIDSRRSMKANYSLNITGEELITDFPLVGHVFFNLTHSFFVKKISDGPVADSAQVSERFPTLYEDAARLSNFHTNRFSLVYDNTDHLYLPRIGTYASASVLYSNKKLGSDYEYQTYAFQVKNYYNYKEEGRFVTAVHALLQYQRGAELPFYALPQLGEGTGLRMAGDGRFTDRAKCVFTIEERMTLSRSPFFKFISETEITPFLDVGTVFPKPSAFGAGHLKYSPGISARLVIRPQLVATVDFATGSEGSNSIVKIGYPF